MDDYNALLVEYIPTKSNIKKFMKVVYNELRFFGKLG